jgi:metal-responsive CopG/Arc/MetJ family transcriptional regulator
VTRIILTMPPELIKLLKACVPPGQSRSEWIREAIRQRILRDGGVR